MDSPCFSIGSSPGWLSAALASAAVAPAIPRRGTKPWTKHRRSCAEAAAVGLGGLGGVKMMKVDLGLGVLVISLNYN